jgi:phospholipid/cholesterol/gamma-HCH transport system substrate-binding protein
MEGKINNMTIKKEVKVGLLGLIGIVIFYLGFNFLLGMDLFSTSEEYHVYYNDVQGLESSNPVKFNGVPVGRVIALTPDYEKGIVDVTLAINKKVNLTENSYAILADDGLIGGKVVKLVLGNGKPLAKGGEIIGKLETGMLQSVQEKMDPVLQNVDSLVISLNSLVKDFDHTGQALKSLMGSAMQTTNGVNGIVAANSKNLSLITGNAAVLTNNLNDLTKSLDAQLKPILANASNFTDSLNHLELSKTVGNLNQTIKGLEGIVSEINKGNGTLGKLAGDDSLYTNLDRTAASLNLLLSDMKVNPKRYVHFSLFGKKEKKKE